MEDKKRISSYMIKNEDVEREEKTHKLTNRKKSNSAKQAWKKHHYNYMRGIRQRERDNMKTSRDIKDESLDIKKLNEKLDKLLSEPINEISDELRNKVIDARQAEYLAAQATADRKKAKFDRISKLGKKLEKKTPETVKTSLVDIAKSLDFKYKEPVVWGEDYVITLTIPDEYIQDGKLTKSAEEELKDLLAEMSDKYGCKYTYKVEKDTVKIICEKPNLDIDKLDKNKDSSEYYHRVIAPMVDKGEELLSSMLGKELPKIPFFNEPYVDYHSGNCEYSSGVGSGNGFFISNMTYELDYPEADIVVGFWFDDNTNAIKNWIPINHPISDKEFKDIIEKTYKKLYKLYYKNTLTEEFMEVIKYDVVMELYNLDRNGVGIESYSDGSGYISFTDGYDYAHTIYIDEFEDSLEFKEYDWDTDGSDLDTYTSKRIKKSDLTIENIKSVIEYIVNETNHKFEELKRTEK